MKMAAKINIKFPDGSVKEFPKGVSGLEILKTLNHKIQKEATGIMVNGEVRSLPESIQEDAEIRILTFADEEGKDVFRHSSAHLMAHAVQRLFPDTKFGIGPPIEDGFYYDIELDHAISPEDFELYEVTDDPKRVLEIVIEGWQRHEAAEKARALASTTNE